MKTVLLAWELGANLGHVGPLLKIARELRRQGHRPILVLRDIVGPRDLLENEDIPVLQAPRWPMDGLVRGRSFWISSYSDSLAAFGFANPQGLAALVRAWDSLLAYVKPDLIIADHSPTLCLAAYGTIPVAITGNGYTVPPVHDAAFPPLYPDRPPLMSEVRILEGVLDVQRRRGRPAPATLPALFDAPVRAVATLPELDPYRKVRREPVLGPIERMPPFTTLPKTPHLFAYLGEEHPALYAMGQCLLEWEGTVEVFLRGDVGPLRRLLASRGARVHATPPPLAEVMPRASIIMSQAGSTTAHGALSAGRPQILCPNHVEADLTAEALVSLGVGLQVSRTATQEEIKEILELAATDESLCRKAEEAAARIASYPPVDALTAVTNACLQLLS